MLTGNSRANAIRGGGGEDAIEGGDGADNLLGEGGNDILSDGAGAETMAGGAGDDYYYADNSLDTASEAAGGGHDTVVVTGSANVSFTLGANVEDLLSVGTGQFGGTGNEGANLITGGNGINILRGGGGNDTLDGGNGLDGRFDVLAGGAGDDVYILDNPAFATAVSSTVTLTENPNEGTDTVRVIIGFHELQANFENLVFTTAARIPASATSGTIASRAAPAPRSLPAAAATTSWPGPRATTCSTANPAMTAWTAAPAMTR